MIRHNVSGMILWLGIAIHVWLITELPRAIRKDREDQKKNT